MKSRRRRIERRMGMRRALDAFIDRKTNGTQPRLFVHGYFICVGVFEEEKEKERKTKSEERRENEEKPARNQPFSPILRQNRCE
jgi:hypothetical protein